MISGPWMVVGTARMNTASDKVYLVRNSERTL